ncbi:MAG: hypothetical protein IPM56_05100 [Ignavibacteriales bacterium]|nr:MAG: hypothetical protein IPM56_05100 [Ignavibacteriales bacterium]
MSNDDLWGDLPEVEKIRTPLDILYDQADVISKKTNNLIEGRVAVRDGKSYLVDASLVLLSNILGYSATIVRITHNVEMYPVTVLDRLSNVNYAAENENDFKEILKEIFNSDSVRKILIALLTQIKSRE